MNKNQLNAHVKIANELRRKTKNFAPEVGIVLGSGWSEVVALLTDTQFVSYSEIKGMPKTTVKGHRGNFVFGKLAGKKVVFVQGRLHMYEGNDAYTATLPIRVLHELGINTLLLTNSAGGVRPEYNIGDLVVITDQINFTGKNPLDGLKPTDDYPVFVDMTKPYDESLSEIIMKSIKKSGLKGHTGTYVQFNGPTYETPAEIAMVKAFGGDLVGMSTGIETIMARYLKLRVAAISCVTNKAAGLEEVLLSHKDVLKVVEENRSHFATILEDVVSKIK